MATVSALAGQELAVDKGLATLPIALQQLAVMLTTFPASMLMKRLGRRSGFTTGSLVGMSGGLLQAHAIFAGDFALFCLGNALVGVANGFTLFYRFAAIDAADAAFKSKAISLVMGGGVAAGICGPLIARWSHDWFQPVAFAGAFIAIALLQTLAGLLVQFIRIPRPTLEERRSAGRPLSTIMRQPVFVTAALGGMIGYGVMSLVMTTTPLAMIDCSYSFGEQPPHRELPPDGAGQDPGCQRLPRFRGGDPGLLRLGPPASPLRLAGGQRRGAPARGIAGRDHPLAVPSAPASHRLSSGTPAPNGCVALSIPVCSRGFSRSPWP
jgi:hypothetical protein